MKVALIISFIFSLDGQKLKLFCRTDIERDVFNEKPTKEDMVSATEVHYIVYMLDLVL